MSEERGYLIEYRGFLSQEEMVGALAVLAKTNGTLGLSVTRAERRPEAGVDSEEGAGGGGVDTGAGQISPGPDSPRMRDEPETSEEPELPPEPEPRPQPPAPEPAPPAAEEPRAIEKAEPLISRVHPSQLPPDMGPRTTEEELAAVKQAVTGKPADQRNAALPKEQPKEKPKKKGWF